MLITSLKFKILKLQTIIYYNIETTQVIWTTHKWVTWFLYYDSIGLEGFSKSLCIEQHNSYPRKFELILIWEKLWLPLINW